MRVSHRLCAAGLLLAAVVVLAARAPAETDREKGETAVLNLSEAAQLLGVEPSVLSQMADRGEVPARLVGQEWRFSRAALLAWLRGKTKTTEGAGSRDPAESGPGSGRIGEAPPERSAEQISLRGTRVLPEPGEVTLELGAFYAERSDRRLVQVDTEIRQATLERQIATALLLGRVGLFTETELFASTRYRYEDASVELGALKVASSNDDELGEVQVGMRRTLVSEGFRRPAVVATVEGRIPTGDSSHAVGGGLALIKSVDPIVLFASANYRYAFVRDFDDVADLEPDHIIDGTLGYALALNDVISLNTSVSGLYSSRTAFDAATVPQQETFSLQLGLTVWLLEGLYAEPSVSIGLGGDDDSFVLGLTLPYTF